MVIIGIILAFLSSRLARPPRAEEDATQALITKLETGLNDRLDALLQNRPDPNARTVLAAIYPIRIHSSHARQTSTRAQVIAWYDYLKSEIPDVFFVQNTTGPYPFNFAANRLSGHADQTPEQPRPLYPADRQFGRGAAGAAAANPAAATATSQPGGYGHLRCLLYAAAGIYKNLGYLPAGLRRHGQQRQRIDRRLG